MSSLAALLREVRTCSLCAEHLPHGPRPVLQAHPAARILIASQAPGRRVHGSGVPFEDASGERLRAWMGVTRTEFYDARITAILPMGFCFPGSGPGGDLPPRPECAPAWRASLLDCLRRVELVLAIGRYAQAYHLRPPGASVTERVRAWERSWPHTVPLPHPSPRNQAWLKRNPWFARELLPMLRRRVRALLEGGGPPRAALDTERLRLRRLTLDDAPFVLELVNDPDWLRFIGDRGVRGLAEARAYLEHGPLAAYARDGLGTLLVESQGTGEALGVCGLIRREGLAEVDLGFAFLRHARGAGYAREAARAVLAQAREDHRLTRVAAVVDPANAPSLRLLEALGFVYQRRVRLDEGAAELGLFVKHLLPPA